MEGWGGGAPPGYSDPGRRTGRVESALVAAEGSRRRRGWLAGELAVGLFNLCRAIRWL